VSGREFDTGGWQPLPGATRNPATPEQCAVAGDLLVLSGELPLCSQRIIDGEMTSEQWHLLAEAWQALARRCRQCAGEAMTIDP
jgi:enamine deaminase RidA (YjgF/YER057c/UK114 family)